MNRPFVAVYAGLFAFWLAVILLISWLMTSGRPGLNPEMPQFPKPPAPRVKHSRTSITREDRALALLIVADQARTMQPELEHFLALEEAA